MLSYGVPDVWCLPLRLRPRPTIDARRTTEIASTFNFSLLSSLFMKDLADVYNRLKQKKSERKDLKSSFQDELKNNAKYQEILEQMNKLKVDKKAIENEVLSREMDKAKLEELNLDIKTDTEMLTDIALNMFLAQENVEITDDMNNRWVPSFKVQFKKS